MFLLALFGVIKKLFVLKIKYKHSLFFIQGRVFFSNFFNFII